MNRRVRPTPLLASNFPHKYAVASLTSEAIANEVGRERNQDLVGKALGVRLVEVLGQDLGPDNVLGIRQTLGSVGHNGNEHVLLLVEPAWVEGDLVTKNVENSVGHELLPCLTEGECEKLGNVGFDTDEGLTDTE